MQQQVLSYRAMRKCIGFLGFALPVFLYLHSLWDGYARGSISAFYYHPDPYVNGFFIGTLCAIGVFLICYRGHVKGKQDWLSDNIITHIAGFTAVCVAIFPTFDPCIKEGLCPPAVYHDKVYRALHYLSAIALFFCLGLMSFRFARGARKPKRNLFYRISGISILVMTGVTIVLKLCSELPIFWTETMIVWAFSAAWFLKGR